MLIAQALSFQTVVGMMNAATTTVELAPAPAVMVTMIPAVVFFSTQRVMTAYSSYAEFTGVAFPNDCWNAATTIVEFAPAPTVGCTMILTVMFFSTQLVLAAYRSYAEFTGVEFPND